MGSAGKEIDRFTPKEVMMVKDILIKLVDSVPFGVRNKIKNIPGLKQLQSLLLKKLVSNKEFVATISGGPAKGLVFPVQMPQDKLMWIGTWELDFADTLYRYIEPGWICYDIGGYKGYYAGIMALKGAAEVFVFEPMPANAEKIKKLIALNSNLPIQLKEYAVSDTCGKVSFKLMPEETMGKLEKSSFQENEKEVSQLVVDCITIDYLVNKGFPSPDFIKIDVEGAEEFVLKGAKDLLGKMKPVLMIEIHSKEIGFRCLSLLKEFYTSVTVFETGRVPEFGFPEICHFIALN